MVQKNETRKNHEISFKTSWRQLLGYAIALACLIWVFHDFRLKELLSQIEQMEWWLLAPAVVFDIASYFCQGLRWELLIRPIAKLSPLRSTQAIYVGLFTNEILPLRIGELVRVFLVSRWIKRPLLTIVPSVMVERFFDGIWLALCIGVVALFVPLPKNLLHAEEILGVAVICLTIIFVIIIFYKEKSISKINSSVVKWKALQKISNLLTKLAEGLHEIGLSRYFFLSLGVSVFILIFQILAYWLIMGSYGIQLSFWAGAAVLLILHMGTAIPNAPSNIGSYQFFTVVGLSLFGIEKSVASGFSIIVFIILTVPLWLIGILAISQTGMKFKTIRAEIKKIRKSIQHHF